MQLHVVTVSWDTHKDKLMAVRNVVFCEEQGVPQELEQDGKDNDGTHFLVLNEAGQAIGCARLLASGSIGRMAVLAQWRNRGIGSRLLASTIATAQAQDLNRVFLSAQKHAEPFYKKHGFISTGGEYVEAGMVHQAMQMALPIPFEAQPGLARPEVREQPAPDQSANAELRHHRGESACLDALTRVLAEPLRSVEIYSPRLDHLLFDTREVVDALSTFVRRGAPARLRILIHSSDLVIGRGHRLLELSRRIDSKIDIRRVPEELASDTHTYVTWDRRGYWLMPDYREYDGLSNHYDPVQANRLDERFEYLWERGISDPELRTLRL